MTGDLTIIMYHYVRDFARTRYPGIKGLDVAGFRRQLDHLQANFEIVRMEDVIAASRGEAQLPAAAALLTFDDGYAEHYDTVFPILHRRGLQGSFFPPVSPVRDGVLLDVNRIHFILASTDSSADLADALDDEVRAAGDEYELRSVEDYRAEWAHPFRWDTAETIYVKRMLQTALPERLRAEIAGRLFERFVGVDEATFAAEQYLTEDQARVMIADGMYFGSHGATHQWLNRVDRSTLLTEIDTSLQFLSGLGMPVDEHWVMCYPFGGHEPEVVEVLRERHCTIGLTTEVATAVIGRHDPLLLPRYDTNDFPQ
ncbi:polysaccharide deacetylase family protein [Jatrophihabitans fulvus]